MLTVLMCCNRDDGFLDEALESVLNQTVKNFEFLIILNNCSDSLHNKILSISDSRVRVYRNSIGQLAFNLNYGIELAKGDYIVRFDSDDVCMKDRLEKTINLISKNTMVDIVAGSAELIDESGNPIGLCQLNPNMDWKKVVNYKNPFIHPATTIRKQFFTEMRGYLGGFQSEDYDLWLRAAKKENVTVVISPEIFIKYRINQFQARGNLLGYAEVAGLMNREFIMRPNIINFASLLISMLKPLLRFIKNKL